jgi:hypothetical protein
MVLHLLADACRKLIRCIGVQLLSHLFATHGVASF